jgi:hypothetical protein
MYVRVVDDVMYIMDKITHRRFPFSVVIFPFLFFLFSVMNVYYPAPTEGKHHKSTLEDPGKVQKPPSIFSRSLIQLVVPKHPDICIH